MYFYKSIIILSNKPLPNIETSISRGFVEEFDFEVRSWNFITYLEGLSEIKEMENKFYSLGKREFKYRYATRVINYCSKDILFAAIASDGIILCIDSSKKIDFLKKLPSFYKDIQDLNSDVNELIRSIGAVEKRNFINNKGKKYLTLAMKKQIEVSVCLTGLFHHLFDHYRSMLQVYPRQ